MANVSQELVLVNLNYASILSQTIKNNISGAGYLKEGLLKGFESKGLEILQTEYFCKSRVNREIVIDMKRRKVTIIKANYKADYNSCQGFRGNISLSEIIRQFLKEYKGWVPVN